MLENAGAYLVGIHGRTRDQKNASEIRANWDVIKVQRSPNPRLCPDVVSICRSSAKHWSLVADALLLLSLLPQAVKEALHVPVIGNGNIRHKQDADDLIAYTGVDGVMSAEALLENPALFSTEHDADKCASATINCI
jgi:tRNA-dihydrouridine synthase 1